MNMDKFFNCSNNISFGDREFSSNQNFQEILYKGEFVGTLIEENRGLLSPIESVAVTFDVAKLDSDGDSERKYKGHWLHNKVFRSLREFEEYVKQHMELLLDIYANAC